MINNRHMPPTVINRAMDLGELGVEWLERLDGMIIELEEQWQIKVGQTLSGGSTAFVAEAMDVKGNNYMLKVEMPHSNSSIEFTYVIHALQAVNGNRYVKLIAYNESKRALLLEKLDQPLAQMDYSIHKQMEIICETLEKTWMKPPSHLAFQTADHVLSWFNDFIWERWDSLNKPCSQKVIKQAEQFLQARKNHAQPYQYVLLHGDAHPNNILRNQEKQFVFVDPDSLYYEKAYDLGVLMREWLEEYESDPLKNGKDHCEYIYSLTGVSKQAIWEWGFLQCVATGLFILPIDEITGKKLLSVAKSWVESSLNIN